MDSSPTWASATSNVQVVWTRFEAFMPEPEPLDDIERFLVAPVPATEVEPESGQEVNRAPLRPG